MALTREQQIAALEKDWAENPRWKGVTRTYSAADVVRLRGSVQPEHTFAKMGAEKLWNLVTQVPSRPSAQRKISSTAWAP
jgi:isocitrate lyase